MTTKHIEQNKVTYNKTIGSNTKVLKSIEPKQKFILKIFYAYFMHKYKTLMSELSHE